jgi:hypothetical protein
VLLGIVDTDRTTGLTSIQFNAMTLRADLLINLLTVAVFEHQLYDKLFCDSVKTNDEGAIPIRAVPFQATRSPSYERLSN